MTEKMKRNHPYHTKHSKLEHALKTRNPNS